MTGATPADPQVVAVICGNLQIETDELGALVSKKMLWAAVKDESIATDGLAPSRALALKTVGLTGFLANADTQFAG